MVLTVGDDVGGHFQGPGCMLKYGNIAKNSQKRAKISEKNGGLCSLLLIMLGNVVRV